MAASDQATENATTSTSTSRGPTELTSMIAVKKFLELHGGDFLEQETTNFNHSEAMRGESDEDSDSPSDMSMSAIGDCSSDKEMFHGQGCSGDILTDREYDYNDEQAENLDGNISDESNDNDVEDC
uniref:Uncharacterized protein n=1 Tax=Amphimedon queenslandica TaxID=400682 RepID=A0A1X7UQB1_AMPQE